MEADPTRMCELLPRRPGRFPTTVGSVRCRYRHGARCGAMRHRSGYTDLSRVRTTSRVTSVPPLTTHKR